MCAECVHSRVPSACGCSSGGQSLGYSPYRGGLDDVEDMFGRSAGGPAEVLREQQEKTGQALHEHAGVVIRQNVRIRVTGEDPSDECRGSHKRLGG
jgi:hypothetical protein